MFFDLSIGISREISSSFPKTRHQSLSSSLTIALNIILILIAHYRPKHYSYTSMLFQLLVVTFQLFAQPQALQKFVANASNQTAIINLTRPVQGGEPGIDPRFSATFEDLKDDLSDRSVYLTGLSAIFSLSQFAYKATSCGGRWVTPGSEDIEILARTSTPGLITLETRFMMWGVLYTVKRAESHNFVASTTQLFWAEDRRTKIHVGSIVVQKTSRPRSLGGSKSGLVTECGSVKKNVESAGGLVNISSAPSTYQSFVDGRRADHSAEIVSFTKQNTTLWTLNNTRVSFEVEFYGRRLPKYGIFISTLGVMIALASLPRDTPFVKGVSLTDDRSGVDILIEPSSIPQVEPPYLDYGKAMWLLWKVPIYMYEVKRFQECGFFISQGRKPFGIGGFRMISNLAGTAIESV